MNKVVQISIVARISGNVNADEVIGTRITLKKMYSSSGEVLPFVSARAIKFAIREALIQKGFKIDPLVHNPQAQETLRLSDSGNPIEFIDNDLFGYMVTEGRGRTARRRHAPISISYFKALKDTPIKSEIGGRFPRRFVEYKNKEDVAPVPFEIEVAEFIGKVNCIMYDYIGKFKEEELDKNSKEKLIKEEKEGITFYKLDDNERKRRIRAFLEVFLTPQYVLPRRTNSLNIPEYIAALISLSERGPIPIFQYLTYNFDKNSVDDKAIKQLINREEIRILNPKLYFIDYLGNYDLLPNEIKKVTVKEVIEEIVNFL